MELSRDARLGGTTSVPRPTSQLRRATVRYRANKLAVVGVGVAALLCAGAILAPLIAPYPYDLTDYDAILVPTGSPGHLMGTDQLGRDLFSRLLYGLRTSLVIAFAAELSALAVAIPVGLTAGLRGGRTDQILMGFADVMYAFPTYLFAIVLVTVIGRSPWAIVVAIGIASWVTQARLVRAQAMSLKEREYVEAARAMGARGPTIAVRYILPNAVGPILVFTSFAIPAAIIAESGLALLGLGVQPPTPSWGYMISDGIRYVISNPHMLLWPAVFFSAALLAFTWIGDGLRDAFDTRSEVH